MPSLIKKRREKINTSIFAACPLFLPLPPRYFSNSNSLFFNYISIFIFLFVAGHLTPHKKKRETSREKKTKEAGFLYQSRESSHHTPYPTRLSDCTSRSNKNVQNPLNLRFHTTHQKNKEDTHFPFRH